MKGEHRDAENEYQSPYEFDSEVMGTFGSDYSSIFYDVFPTLPNWSREEAVAAGEASTSHQVPCPYQEPSPNPNPNENFMSFISTPDPNAGMWIPNTESSMVMPDVSAPPELAYHQHYPFAGGAMNCEPYPPQMPQPEYQMLESAQTWTGSQFDLGPQYNSFPDQYGDFVPIAPHPVAPVYGDQYQSQVYNGTINNDRGVRLDPSATKEARQKRMARKKWGLFHRNHTQQNQIQKIHSPEQNSGGKLGAEYCTNSLEGQSQQQLWIDRGQSQQLKKQGFKGEKNLKFLLQKVLKQSDVGNLGRIVLPKEEAEAQLPQLEERDGIQIFMEDLRTSKVWNLRYRFWPNNKSRMYVLENTGEFVKVNGLQEGDFIVIYSDIKCGKYLIRGVKVRQPMEI